MANNLASLVRRRNLGFTGMEGELLNDNAMPVNALASYQPMNTIRASSGEYITPEGGRSASPVRFGGNSLRQPMRSQSLSGDELTQMAVLANRSPQQAAMAAQRFLQANPDLANEPGFSGEELAANMSDNTFSNILGQRAKNAYAEQERMAAMAEKPSDRLAREKFEWEKSQAKPQDKGQFERVQTATDALDLIQQAKGIFDEGKATGSLLGKAGDVAAGAFGVSTEGAKASAQLKALGGALVAKMPKMSGPQSDKDVQLYREMAGQIADETVPIETRRAALDTVEQIQRKYAGLQGSEQPAQTSSIPKTGHIQDGYIFLGGDPADPKRWRKQ